MWYTSNFFAPTRYPMRVTVEQNPPEVLSAVPFIKWAGGKRWLAGAIAELLSGDGRHIEPFAGSAACFFASHSQEAQLSDNNDELMNCYRVVRDNASALITAITSCKINKKTFERFRSATGLTSLDRATRFIYLNRTAFNGLYRVNRHGQFNVPFGCKPSTVLCDKTSILQCSERLRNVDLLTCDFRKALGHLRKSDVAYIDPPYTLRTNSVSFRRYNERLFSWEDQVCLAQIANRLAAKNIRLIISNALHSDITNMYSKQYFHAARVTRSSTMAAAAAKRGTSEELLLISRAVISHTKPLKALLNHHLPARTQFIRLRSE
ncbi:MAG: Dam family site-specific DNA-(adenine-N6)-methyltransferase [Pirellulales bacterium]